MDQPQLIITTDLDGTLLDHHGYDFSAATVALDFIQSQNIPLILCSSKTSAEIAYIQQQIGLSAPFICENGAGIVIPDSDQSSSVVYPAIIDLLQDLKAHYQFTGFADLDDEAIQEVTGLNLETAKLAKQRLYSEPLIWQDSEEKKVLFLQTLADNHFKAQQGGRFLTVTAQHSLSKGEAMLQLINCYYQPQFSTIVKIVLGDSPNDLSMLNLADIAVIIPAAIHRPMPVTEAKRVLTVSAEGATGWQQAMDTLLPEYFDNYKPH